MKTHEQEADLFRQYLKENKKFINEYSVFYMNDQEYTYYKKLDKKLLNKIFDDLKKDKTESGDAMIVMAFTDTCMIKFSKRTAPEKYYRYF